ncbi:MULTISPECIES: FecCD family ABC transporter permease [Marinobacter]|uniref:Iron ABC transporter permease n=1 Tax=Marinobacter xiaoshiensis TaxID=3073652 RepID=A0ABU2HEA9_9GAMM|nr:MULTISPECIES: iron ABC transporter permease [unclassified Marinobacter]MBK1872232.1 iron ABC transporter permease [Marinobacter sp. 1-3A]MBK1887096.1 iron ABC transporter permease [Marinobacter sp. DY40_1A1]MDS1308670.1 iron ABC transporter permease [Marinobacter sp. F60267]
MATDTARRVPAGATFGVLAALAVLAALFSLTNGAYPLGAKDVLNLLVEPALAKPATQMVFFEVRMPRLVLGFLTGAVLAVSGTLLQGLFRNPLADPGLIGVSGGAALAAVSVIVLGGSWLSGWALLTGRWALPLAAFLGSVVTTLLAWRVASRSGGVAVATLLLAGIAINAVAGALTGLLTFYADDGELRSLTFWSMGSLGRASWEDIRIAGPWMLVALLLAPLLAKPLDAFALGESVAGHLGFSVQWVKRATVLLSALGTGAAVAVTGLIGFVGLVVPHLLRQIVGAGHRVLIPASGLAGGVLLVAADSLARVVVAPAELPIGLMMSLLGGPFFLVLLMRMRIGA